MRHRHAAAALLVTLAACATSTVEVTPLRPTPRALTARAIEAVQIYPAKPEGGVAVYNLVASGDVGSGLEAAVRQKAAALGCDGLVITVREQPSQTTSSSLTGQLNDHRDLAPGHVTALCVVLPAAAAPTTGS